MECKMCGKIFDDYKLYDIEADLKADSYICKGCLIKETLKWNIEHPDSIKQWKVEEFGIIVYPRQRM